LIDVQGIPFLFRWCPAGTFLMGSPPVEWKRDVDEDQVEVTLSRGFWLLETEVTQLMWKTIMGNDRPLHWSAEAGLGDEYPAYRVSGWDAQRFCDVLTTQLRRQRQLPSEWRASLPTEAEWEYACRAGSAGPYCFGDDAQGLQEFAWFSDNTQGMNRPVRTRQANGWGLSDMHGSVWEWTASRYEPRARGGVDPPVFPLSTDRGQHDGSWVLRGGSCVMGASGCRSAIRKAYERSSTDLQLGFRPCLRVGPPLPGAVGESASVAPDVNEQPAEPGRVEWPAGATDE
jgi:formylglycine-generating enzyme required for sulfatase activity